MRLNDVELTGSLDISGSINLPRHPDTGSATEATGSIFLDTTDNAAFFYDGVDWKLISTSIPGQIISVGYVLVAGGGGGSLGIIDPSQGIAGTGGGAGGVTSGSSIVNPGEVVAVTIGAGGRGGELGSGTTLNPQFDSANGNNSVLSVNASVVSTAIGGGKAGYRFSPLAGSGGSGGTDAQDSAGPGGSGTAGQGTNGAAGGSSATSRAGGGGGGQSVAGTSPTNPDGTAGGDGFIESLTTGSEQIAGGGCGGATGPTGNPTTNNYGGGTGGAAESGNAGNGNTNTGGGGGGGGAGTSTLLGQNLGGTGGSGVCYLQIPTTSFNTANLSGTVNIDYTLSTNGSDTVVRCLQTLTYTNN